MVWRASFTLCRESAASTQVFSSFEGLLKASSRRASMTKVMRLHRYSVNVMVCWGQARGANMTKVLRLLKYLVHVMACWRQAQGEDMWQNCCVYTGNPLILHLRFQCTWVEVATWSWIRRFLSPLHACGRRHRPAIARVCFDVVVTFVLQCCDFCCTHLLHPYRIRALLLWPGVTYHGP